MLPSEIELPVLPGFMKLAVLESNVDGLVLEAVETLVLEAKISIVEPSAVELAMTLGVVEGKVELGP